jgi:hypothetical protein
MPLHATAGVLSTSSIRGATIVLRSDVPRDACCGCDVCLCKYCTGTVSLFT